MKLIGIAVLAAFELTTAIPGIDQRLDRLESALTEMEHSEHKRSVYTMEDISAILPTIPDIGMELEREFDDGDEHSHKHVSKNSAAARLTASATSCVSNCTVAPLPSSLKKCRPP